MMKNIYLVTLGKISPISMVLVGYEYYIFHDTSTRKIILKIEPGVDFCVMALIWV